MYIFVINIPVAFKAGSHHAIFSTANLLVYVHPHLIRTLRVSISERMFTSNLFSLIVSAIDYFQSITYFREAARNAGKVIDASLQQRTEKLLFENEEKCRTVNRVGKLAGHRCFAGFVKKHADYRREFC